MENERIIVYVSSRNNYDMVEGAVLKNIDFDGYEFVNVDDGSDPVEQAKGKEQAKRLGFTYLQNKERGVQYATQTLIDWVKENRPNCKWIVCFQHDIWPISDKFFDNLNSWSQEESISESGLIGFNVLDEGKYTKDALERFNAGEKPMGMIGMMHLSVRDNRKRWLCPDRQPELVNHEGFKTPFNVEFPMWAAVAINVDQWVEHIQPTQHYHFHLWLPDIAMQFNYKNIPTTILPDLYCKNHQDEKAKFGINPNSAQGAMQGNERHFGSYGPHLKAWRSRWGWDYERTETFEAVRMAYEGTLIAKYYDHDITQGPIQL